MNTVLLILGILGIGAIVISVYVFTVAARNYVSDEHKHKSSKQSPDAEKLLIKRNSVDRRQALVLTFPITVNGVVVLENRRKIPDRRLAA